MVPDPSKIDHASITEAGHTRIVVKSKMLTREEFASLLRPKVGLGRARAMGAKASLIHPSHQGVCGRLDTEDSCVTPGDLSVSWF
jgi:hypothetical protein